MKIHVDINNCKSYKTAASLDAKLAEMPEHWRYIKVWTQDGRHTAVFTVNSLQGDVSGPARLGFATIG